jgi:D-alanyl-D-alanine dipeptidase
VSELREPPEGFTDLRTIAGVRLDVGYHRPDNFMCNVADGYAAPGAWLVDAAAERLAAVSRDLSRERLGLVVHDAYRPRRATRQMVAWCETHGMEHLLDGWIGRESRHNRGTAVDVSLVQLGSGARLPMGSAWDEFESASIFDVAVGPARAHRRLLREAMTRHGFRPYDREWWHFELTLDPMPPPRDVPYGRDERDEREMAEGDDVGTER